MNSSSTYQGDALDIMIYGESHSEAIGVYINGLPEDVIPDSGKTAAFMARRAPGKNAWSTPRKEPDEVIFERNGAMLHGYIINTNTKPKDYASIMNRPRPSHADYAARLLYGDEASKSGGGIFSGRMTAPLCIAGSIALQELNKRGIQISAHLKRVGGIDDDSYFDHGVNDAGFRNALTVVETKDFPVVDDAKGELMKEKIEQARLEGDSVGGIIECVVYGYPEGIGGPIFDGIEAKLAQILYAIPAVKGVEFGNGFKGSDLKGSENNDAFVFDDEGNLTMKTNHSGGIQGGISLGDVAPIVFDVAMKPTPSISKDQDTVDLEEHKNTTIKIEGRHDPCVAPRAVPVVEAAAAIALYDMLLVSM
ncbi:MAG: chorismate synthase [Clostridiales bacterium]|jgi:chorismate synthase|nr:chorismate synthase [Clostridiales bacterium]